MTDVPPSPPPARPGLVAGVMGWTKANPILAFIVAAIPTVGSIVGLVSNAPGAWRSALGMVDLPACGSYASTYTYATGSFVRNGPKSWHEKNAVDQFDFEEVRRAPDFILLLNLTQRSDPRWPTMLVRLPPCGGTAQWTYENPEAWIDLFQVWR